ncbi:MAG: hypothetical protein JSU88_04825 [Nitrospinaceae bacterium]|nr:MAG: hypothetical protein JSU88_04825 [Nitrospinaceae bacterium]
MPGPVIEGHAKYEDQCTQCHDLFQKESQNKKCLHCHKDVGKDLAKGRGFHGKTEGLGKRECKTCHREHVGRKADVLQLDRENFDHAAADFELRGAHVKTRCAGCHLSGKKFRDAPHTCHDCHKTDDRHEGRLGTDCRKCHNPIAWSESLFDHDKKTRFPLKGKHRKVACAACHPGDQYKKTPVTCAACHTLNDKHRGTFGKKCETCHLETAWKTSLFDHDRDTKFKLLGIHQKTACKACHKGTLYKENLSAGCASCHANDDTHKGQFGPKCDTCHKTPKWSEIAFDHDRDTKFKLVERHRKLRCVDCHRGVIAKEKLGVNCLDCHRDDDVHKGQEGKNCTRCHNQKTWGKQVKFDHGTTRFPLEGLHALATCEGCHLTAAYKETPAGCADCHRQDDIHNNTLGRECGLCHHPEGFAAWRFDHDVQADFALKGGHREVACRQCHTRPVEGKLSLTKTCVSCHRDDDVHKGQQGEGCDHCHNERAWGKKVAFDHDLTRFPLIGIHALTSCESCHLTAKFKEVKTSCIACHLGDDVHKKSQGTGCTRCHTPNGWSLWEFDHNTETRFRLDGGHSGIACEGCHRRPAETEKDIRLARDCIACHQKDDEHRGRFGPACDRCHDTRSFKHIRMRGFNR